MDEMDEEFATDAGCCGGRALTGDERGAKCCWARADCVETPSMLDSDQLELGRAHRRGGGGSRGGGALANEWATDF